MLAASPARTDTTASWAVPSKSPADRSAESPARWGFRRLGNDDDGAAASAAFAVTPNHAENEPSVARPRRASHRGGANDRKRSGFSDHGGCSGYVTLTEMEGPPSPPSPPEPPEPGSPLPLPEPPDSRRADAAGGQATGTALRRHLRARRPRRHRRRCCEAEGRRSRRSRRSRRRLRHHRGRHRLARPHPSRRCRRCHPARRRLHQQSCRCRPHRDRRSRRRLRHRRGRRSRPCRARHLWNRNRLVRRGGPTRRRRRHLRRRQALRQNPRDR